MLFVRYRKKAVIRASWVFLILIFNIWISGCQTLIKSQSPPGVYHTVLQGQTLFSIAEVYDLNLKALQRVNGIRDPSKIETGRRLWIPKTRHVLSVPVRVQEPSVPKSAQLAGKWIEPPKKAGKPVFPIKGFLDWPIRGGILTSKFGMRWGQHHDGIDIASKTGTVIYAAADGKVVFSGKGPKGYGLMIIIKHANNLMTVYAHNSVNHVGRSMRVHKGQKIALVGSTGRSTGSHLHFEVRNNTHPINPLKHLSPNKVSQVARR